MAQDKDGLNVRVGTSGAKDVESALEAARQKVTATHETRISKEELILKAHEIADAATRYAEAFPVAEAELLAEWEARGHNPHGSTGFALSAAARAKAKAGCDYPHGDIMKFGAAFAILVAEIYPKPPTHDVLKDRTQGGAARLTCRSPECNGATLVYQPYMTQEQWTSALLKFFEEHPCVWKEEGKE